MNRSKNILFILDFIEDLENHWKSDSTIALMFSAFNMGFNCYLTYEDGISFYLNNLFFDTRKIIFNDDPYLSMKYYLKEPRKINSADLDLVLVRKEPPFNMEYITMLSLLMLCKAPVINNPIGMIRFQEKFAPMFLNEFSPKTLLTSSYKNCLDFIFQFGKVVLKPLYSFQGRDVFFIEGDCDTNFDFAFNYLIKKYSAPVIVQEFIPEIYHGDLRVIMINGEPEFCYSRIPVEGSFLSGNSLSNSKIVSAELTKGAKTICSKLSPYLKNNGLSFVAIDIIGDFLIEVNSTCPTGLQALRALSGKNCSDYVLSLFLENL